MSSIDTGDYVRHRPTGEQWIVAYVRGDRLAWLGWPEGEAALADCELIDKAPPARREKWLRLMAESSGDGPRQRYARHILGGTGQRGGAK
jgi:hypothetical protein